MEITSASAGSGKTTTLTKSLLSLVKTGVPLRRIAAITFTRAGANDLRLKLREAMHSIKTTGEFAGHTMNPDTPEFKQAERELASSTISTIHSFAAHLLRINATTLSMDPDFSVIEAWQASQMFEEELTTLLTLIPTTEEHPLQRHLHILEADNLDPMQLITGLFEKRQLHETLTPSETPESEALHALYQAAFHRYSQQLGPKRIAPPELETKALLALRTPAVHSRILERVQHLLIDEYQDVNPIQGAMFNLLEDIGVTVHAVGDPKQSIYLFRSADINQFRNAMSRSESKTSLTTTYRHARLLTRFHNRVTRHLGNKNLGFSSEEAPELEAHRTEMGRLELHYVSGHGGIGNLRHTEAKVLAERLKAAHEEQGVPWNDMAILMRSRTSLPILTRTLDHYGVPYLQTGGGDYYQRQEILDLITALRVTISPTHENLAAFFRTAFGNLTIANITALLTLTPDDLLETVKNDHPQLGERIDTLMSISRLPANEILSALINTPFLEGEISFMETLDAQARDNVTHLARTLNRNSPSSLSHLIDELEERQHQTDASSIPQVGDAITIITVHSSKGLEWPMTAVFDVGVNNYNATTPLIVDRETGEHHIRGTEAFDKTNKALVALNNQETYRLLYVALTRARDTLIITGSHTSRMGPMLKALDDAGFGPNSTHQSTDSFILQNHEHDDNNILAETGKEITPEMLELTPSTTARITPPAHPPIDSPSQHAKRKENTGGSDYLDNTPTVASTIGTLVHHAINQNWNPSNPDDIASLENQVILRQHTPEEQQAITEDVLALIGTYQDLLSSGAIPGLTDRSIDRHEVPLQLNLNDRVWTGVLDRLYQVKSTGEWILEDYKTDRAVKPEAHYAQLALYREGIRQALGVTPAVQLVYLRSSSIHQIQASQLDAALATLN